MLITSKGRTWEFPTVTLRVHGKVFVHADDDPMEWNRSTKYLDFEFTPQAEKFQAKKLVKSNEEIQPEEKRRTIQTNRRYYAYKPNLRGFLKYFYILSSYPPKKRLIKNY